MSTVDEKTAVVVVAGTQYVCSAEVADYVNNDSAPCHVVIRSPMYENGSSLPPMYKGTGIKRDRERAKVDNRSRLDWSEETFTVMLLDKGIPAKMVDQLVQAYTVLRDSIPRTPGKTLYKWTGNDLVDKCCSVPNAAVRIVIGVLTTNMPQPTVQEIRNHMVHDGNTEQLYTDEMSSVLAFAIWWTKPYAERKIMSFENERTGRVYGRTLHRTTDMGQQGRLFSDADISDIVNRSILISFCPIICRVIPVSDKGTGYLVLGKCTAKKEIGEHVMSRAGNKGTLCGSQDALKRRFKKYRCTPEQWAAASLKNQKQWITEQMYNDLMSELPSIYAIESRQKRNQVYSEHMVTRQGWWIVYTCTETGQKFRVFTQSASRADRLSSFTGIVAELDGSIADAPKAGIFGVGEQPPTILRADSVQQYNSEGVYFKTLKFMMYNIFEYLFRRAVEFNEMFSEHNTTRKAVRNYETEFSLYGFWKQAKNGRAFTHEQLDIMDVELTLPENLPQAKAGYRRVQLYRDNFWRRTGHESTITRWNYEKLKERVYSELRIIAESDAAVPVQPFTEMTAGPGLLPVEKCPLYVPRALPCDGIWMNSEIQVRGLVKRTSEEIDALDKDPRVLKYSEYKTVHVDIPVWESTDGRMYIEQNHDDC